MMITLQSLVGGAKTKWTHPYNYDSFTIWVGQGKPNGTVYTDRLYQWDSEKHDLLCMKHFGDFGQYWDCRATSKIEEFLRDYLEKPELELCKIDEHCNQATGYPVWSFDYFDSTEA